MVWRHDVDANQFFSLSGYLRHTRATFKTDPFNVLAYTPDPTAPSPNQDRKAYSTGLRLDYTYVHTRSISSRRGSRSTYTGGEQFRLFTLADDGAVIPPVICSA